MELAGTRVTTGPVRAAPATVMFDPPLIAFGPYVETSNVYVPFGNIP